LLFVVLVEFVDVPLVEFLTPLLEEEVVPFLAPLEEDAEVEFEAEEEVDVETEELALAWLPCLLLSLCLALRSNMTSLVRAIVNNRRMRTDLLGTRGENIIKYIKFINPSHMKSLNIKKGQI
jgi:hypothetical protein